MSNILITGCAGQLGSEFKELSKSYNYNFFFTDKTTLDIANQIAIKEYLIKNGIDIIVNCAAYTAVDKAESEYEKANTINHLAVEALAQISKDMNIKLIHISTDYVFDGINYKPYTEEDITTPKNSYGKTKLAGEKAIQKINPKNSIIIRTSWLYSSYGSNFVKTISSLAQQKESLKVVYDQIGSPTYAKDLAKAILELIPSINNNKTQIYHYSHEGVLSWYDFAKEIVRMIKSECKVYPIPSKEYPTPAPRPHYTLLDKSKIKKEFNLEIPYWKDGLDECLKQLRLRR